MNYQYFYPFGFLLFLLTQTNCATKHPVTVTGKIERVENFESRFISSRNVDVWLPENYSPEKQYAVLYMHDGQMLFDAKITWNKQEWKVDEVISKLLVENKIRDCIVVGIWNRNDSRHSDYFPQKAFELLPAHVQDSLIHKAKRNGQTSLFGQPVQSDNYLKFIVEELKPFIDKTYPTRKDRENTFIAGSSMGGLISMYAICEYPEIFGGAACMSTHWVGTFTTENNPVPDAFMQYLAENLPDPSLHKIYFDYGTETLDALYEPYQKQADKIMAANGYTAKNHLTKKFPGDGHSELAWQKRLHIPLLFLMGK